VATGDSSLPPGSWAFPLVDVTQLGNDGYACAALPAGSLAGSIALIQRGPAANPCNFSTKMGNAVNAGALGAVFYMADSSAPIGPSGISAYGYPGGMVSLDDGAALKSFIAANPGRGIAFNPAAVETGATANQLAVFSSTGPSTGDGGLKPDLLATGTNIFMAAQRYDPLGALYSADGFAVANGTSFATPITSGAAALVKQKHPNFSAAQVKSALVNTATPDVTTDSSGRVTNMLQTGGGKLDAGAAVNNTVTAVPASIAFGVVRPGTLPLTATVQITNTNSSAVSLAASLASSSPSLALNKQNLTLPAGGSDTIVVTLSGTVPSPGVYSGGVLLQGSGVSLRIPFLYVVGSGTVANLIPLSGSGFVGTVSQIIPAGIIAFRLVDAFGLPVAGAAVTYTQRGGGTLQNADRVTDANGIAAAEAILGPQPGNYSFTVTAGGQRYTFSGYGRAQPAIAAGGVANGANFDTSSPLSPGSYISIVGTGLSDFVDYPVPGASLPLAIDYVNVSFDVPAAGLSVPGRLTYVSPTQVNVQVPWELQGQTTAQVKVTIDYSPGNVVTVPLADSSPAFFETAPGNAAALDTGFRVINTANPVARGQIAQFYVNGLGPTTNQPASGDPAPASPLAQTRSLPVVTVGGQAATVLFSGLAPGFAGLYQLNVAIPASLSPGTQPVVVAIAGKTSKASGIVVK
jgi:uncharacterized protein (TIGR03437 family)